MSKDILGGDVETQVLYRPDTTSFATALAAAKADQEMVCGYKLVLTKSRSTEGADEQGRFVEVFVTFSPVPVVTEEQMQADPSLRPPPEPEPIPAPFNGDGTIVLTPLPPGTKQVVR